MELVSILVAEVLPLLGGWKVHLAQQNRVTATPPEERSQVAQVVVRIEFHVLIDAVDFEQERHGIDAKAGEALREPEADHLADLLAHCVRRDVEIGLVAVKAMEVVLARLRVVRPNATLIPWEHLAFWAVVRDLVSPDGELAKARISTSTSILEPFVLVGAVIHDEVGDDAQAAVLRGADELREVAKRSDSRSIE